MSDRKSDSELSGWVGWIAFASVMLLMAGVFHMIAGLVALFRDTVYVVGQNNLWALDYTQWGWIHLLGGSLAVLAAFSLVAGKMYGRVVGVLVAALSMVVNMLFMPVYPLWSILIVVVNVLAIYAIIVHGDELKQ